MREKSPHSCYFVLLPKVLELLKAIIIIWFPIHSSLHSFSHPLSITACVLQGQRDRRYPSKYLCTVDSVSRSRAFQTTNLLCLCFRHNYGQSSTLKTENTAASAARRDRCANSELKCHQSRSVAQLQISHLLSGYVSMFFNRLSN